MPPRTKKVSKKKVETGERVYLPLTAKQKARAKATIPAMMKELKKGRWKSRKQAIAVGLSKARRG
jgi:hypothetical protein